MERKTLATLLAAALTLPLASLPPGAATHSQEPSLFDKAWSWDLDGNEIDDALDAMLAGGEAPARVAVFLNYVSNPSDGLVEELSQRYGAEGVYRFYALPAVRALVPLSAVPSLAERDEIWGVELAPRMEPSLDVSAAAIRARQTTVAGAPWDGVWQNPVGSPAGGVLGLRGEGQVIAILDTGIDDRHRSLDDLDDNPLTNDPKVIAGADVSGTVPVEVNPEDDNLHGTHVAGIAAGTGPIFSVGCQCFRNNFAGIAPQARLVDVKIATGGVDAIGSIAVGLDWIIRYNKGLTSYGVRADDELIDVFNLSFGGGTSRGDDFTSRMVNEVTRNGIVAVSSAGNSGSGADTLSRPGTADGAITVAASDPADTVPRGDDFLASFSSRGKRPDDFDRNTFDELKPEITAPGQFICSALMRTPSSYICLAGTSMAAPHIAGVAALMLQANPSLRPADKDRNPVKDILIQTAEYKTAIQDGAQALQVSATGKFGLPWNNGWGYGLVDALAAVQKAVAVGPQPLQAFAGDYLSLVGDATELQGSATGGRPPYEFAWDLDNDGLFDDATGQDATHTFLKGANPIALRVVDAAGSVAVGSGTVTVRTPLLCDDFESGDGLWTKVNGGEGQGAIDTWQNIDHNHVAISIARPSSGTTLEFVGTPVSSQVAPIRYEKGADAMLVSPVLPLDQVEGPVTLTYRVGGFSEPMDVLSTEVRSGGSWVTLKTETGHVIGRSDVANRNLFDLVHRTLDLTPYLGAPTQLRFRFTAPLVVDDVLIGGWNIDDVCITVENIRSSAAFDVSKSTPTDLETVTLTSRAQDPDSPIVKEEWDLGDGTLATGRVVEHRWADDGIYEVTLTATSADGDVSSLSRFITVSNVGPTAKFSVKPSVPSVGQPARFVPDAKDLDGSIASYRWNFGDGSPESSEASPVHVYARGGFFRVTLTVLDDDGASATASRLVAVCDPGLRGDLFADGSGGSLTADACIRLQV